MCEGNEIFREKRVNRDPIHIEQPPVDAPFKSEFKVNYNSVHRVDLHSRIVDNDIRFYNDIAFYPLLKEQEPLFKARNLYDENNKDQYDAVELARRSNRYSAEFRRMYFEQTAIYRRQLLNKIGELRDKLHSDEKTDENKKEVMKVRLELVELDRKSQEQFCKATSENETKERFLIAAASIRTLRSRLRILYDAAEAGLDVEKEILSTRKKLESEEAAIRQSDGFSQYLADYQNAHREADLKTLNETDKEQILKLEDLDRRAVRIKDGDYALSDLRLREEKLLASRFKDEKDSKYMKSVKNTFSRLARALEDPKGDYQAQKSAIYACYEDAKNACRKYMDNHKDKWYSFKRSAEGRERRRLVQEYLDRISYEQDTLFRNMELLKKDNPEASWSDALELTRQTAELHMVYLDYQKNNNKDKPERINWNDAALQDEKEVTSSDEAYKLINTVFSIPVADSMLKGDYFNQNDFAAALAVIRNCTNRLSLFVSPENGHFSRLPEALQQELLCKYYQLRFLGEGMSLIEKGAEGSNLTPEEYKTRLEEIKKNLKTSIKAGNTSFDTSGIISTKNKGTKDLIRMRAKEYHLKGSEDTRDEVRTKDSYIIPFNAFPEKVRLSKHQQKKKLNSTRSVIERVVGRDVYNKYDELVKNPHGKDRKIDIHHSLGTKLVKEGNRVINLDLAGSGFREFRREPSGSHGKTSTEKLKGDDAALFESTYGKHYKVRGKEDSKYVFSKGNIEQGKVSYSIGGSLAMNGLLNSGDYSIDNQIRYAYTILQNELTLILAQWREGVNNKPVYINIQSHSRGAVAAGKVVLLIHNWLSTQPEEVYNLCKERIKFNLIQMDPVAGLGNDTGLNHSIDLKNPNEVIEDNKGYEGFADPRMINATTIYSMFSDYSSTTFPPQYVRGQERIILKACRHNMGLEELDASQTTVKGDGKIHRKLVVDSESLHGYRGSGYNELPAGVYVEDENGVLVRMRNAGQAEAVINGLKEDAGDQSGRHNALKEIIRAWFNDHGFGN